MRKPLLLDFAVPRTNDAGVVYCYDRDLDVNVIEVGGKKVPFIEANKEILELLTKTAAETEKDDEENAAFLELETKTRIRKEQDD